MRISRVTLIPLITALGAAGTILAAPAMAAPTARATYVYVHSSNTIGGPGVYVHS